MMSFIPCRAAAFLFGLSIVFCCSAFAQESLDNLPLPRWAALAAPEINLRTGPGKRYPIDWVLKKKTLPVEIQQEFDNWRLVKEPEGATGWVHRSMLSGSRYVMIRDERQLMAQPAEQAHAVARIRPGVIARLKACQIMWCQVEADGYQGWVRKKNLWGIYGSEVFE